jgi:rhamnosyltransferase
MSVRVAILIRTKNEAKWFPETLARLTNQSRPADEIVVVDSGSTDETMDIARSTAGVRLLVIDAAEFTYGRSLNFGFSETDCDLVACLSAHALPRDNRWLEEFVRPFEDPRVIGAYGRQIPHPDAYPCVQRDLAEFYGDTPHVQTNPDYHKFSNANSLVRRKGWLELRFDEHLPYCEDQLWARSMIERGYAVAYTPDAAVLHSHKDSLRSVFARCLLEETAWRVLQGDRRRGLRSSIREIQSAVAHDCRFNRELGFGAPWIIHSFFYRSAQSLGRLYAHQLPLMRELS